MFLRNCWRSFIEVVCSVSLNVALVARLLVGRFFEILVWVSEKVIRIAARRHPMFLRILFFCFLNK